MTYNRTLPQRLRRLGGRLRAGLSARLQVGLVGGTTAAWHRAEAASQAPNIIIVMVNSLRADQLGYLSPGSTLTPNIDRLADQSVRFTKAVSPAPWTKPAVSSMFTGLYPSVHGATTRGTLGAQVTGSTKVARAEVIRAMVPTLAECLAASGYTTAAFTGGGFTHRVYQGRGFHHFDGSAYRLSEVRYRCASWLATRPRAPLFVWLHAYDTHRPYRGPLPLGRFLRPKLLNLTNTDVRAINSGRLMLTTRQQAELRSLYDAGVRSMDREMGMLLQPIRTSGVLDKCVLVLASDHGEALYEHRLVEHADVAYNEVLHVPLLIRAPGIAPQSIDQYVRLMDLMPTLLEFAGCEIPRMQGVSLMPAILHGEDLHLAAFSELETGGRARVLQMTVAGRDYKVIRWTGTNGVAVFDLSSDPGEECNLSGRVGPEAESLLSRLDVQIRENDGWAAHAVDTVASERVMPELGPEITQRLRDLGYLD